MPVSKKTPKRAKVAVKKTVSKPNASTKKQAGASGKRLVRKPVSIRKTISLKKEPVTRKPTLPAEKALPVVAAAPAKTEPAIIQARHKLPDAMPSRPIMSRTSKRLASP